MKGAAAPSRRRIWLFRMVAVVAIPAVVLGALEIGLRGAGIGYLTDYVITRQIDGESIRCDNQRFAWRFFPRKIARNPGHFVIPPKKAADTYRIFVMGGSAAEGFLDPSFSFARVLEVMLEDYCPAVKFEVYNTAVSSINSYVVREIARDCAREGADLFVVYLGNNEVVGPFGAGGMLGPMAANLHFIRAGILLKKLRMVQLLGEVVQGLGGGGRQKTEIDMFVENQLRLSDEAMGPIYAHFEANLSDVCRVGGEAAPVILCTVTGNLKDSPPFGSLHRADLSEQEEKQWDDYYGQGVTLESVGKYTEAVDRYRAAGEIDGTYAELQYRLGRCYELSGDYEQAREKYVSARDLDTIRFRADSRINEIIRAVGQAAGVHLVDAAAVFAENSRGGIPDSRLFEDYCHMNFNGHYLLARAVFEKIRTILPDDINERAGKGGPVLSEIQCAQRLGYTNWDRLRVAQELHDWMDNEIFARQLDHKRRLGEVAQRINTLKIKNSADQQARIAQQYEQAIEGRPDDWRLHFNYGFFLLEAMQRPDPAARHLREVLKRIPQHSEAHYALGQICTWQGKSDEAVEHYRQAIETEPDHAMAHHLLAKLLRQRGEEKLADKHQSIAEKLMEQ